MVLRFGAAEIVLVRAQPGVLVRAVMMLRFGVAEIGPGWRSTPPTSSRRDGAAVPKRSGSCCDRTCTSSERRRGAAPDCRDSLPTLHG
jgi:hypothetical protein